MPEHIPTAKPRRTEGWMGIRRGHQARLGEVIAEKLILAISLSTIAMVFLIFLFVGREAFPVLLGRVSSAAAQEKPLPVEAMNTLTPAQLRAYLGLSAQEFSSMDRDTIQSLMEVRIEASAEEKPSRDAELNTVAWRYLLFPFQWSDYDKPVYVWQPVSGIHKYNIMPLVVGSLKTTIVALLFAVPLSLAAAIYVSQLANPRWKEWIKPAIEMLSAVPSVVLGAFALLVLATALQSLFGYQYRLNAFLAGIALGLTCVPVIFSIAEDALTSVPRSYTQAALALGASKWAAAWQIVVPAAIPGLFAAVVLGFGRCIGETMVVLIASGNAAILSPSLIEPVRTITATIAAELGETVVGGHHYRMLFVLGTLLFIVTFLTNLAGDVVIHRLKGRLEGKK
ncbi:MAG: phosphate ABC transporter permease subunit PstC [Verrucomicrobiales bacterium]|nr:phosphate ABC transporter permease subunit PstC [Verrucomicrobiales bacterium]